MKIAVIGGAGIQGSVTVRDLSESPEVKEILVADYQEEKAKEYAASFKDPRIKGAFVDAYNIDETANLIKGYDTVINAAQYDTNISIMKACLQAKVHHYNDLGGAFIWTRKQVELFDDFKKAGLTAVCGIGAAPGITNVMARYAYERLDEVEEVHFAVGGVDLTDMKGIDVFLPFSTDLRTFSANIRTVMRANLREPVEFIDGEYKTFPSYSGVEEIMFPEPIGLVPCPYVMHPEVATIPSSFKDKGVKEVTMRMILNRDIVETSKCLARVGMGSEKPIKVHGVEVVPLEVLAAVVNRQLKEKLEGVDIKLNRVSCFRVRVVGKKNGEKAEYIVYFIGRPHSSWGVDHFMAVPASIVAQMQVKGMIKEPGVWGPEQVVDPEYFFKELTKREIHIKSELKEDVV